ncbi:hypothetical protein B0181_07500 [Moraxella caviae]|uniref:HD Cas3-type domain-containing protein n=1 Tax=Moraxella caviae TaxID=34060 RepID=A0A1S9ZZS3_9GAMM|nr:hypothetical protein B0181_07500 [Moraxella caviae]
MNHSTNNPTYIAHVRSSDGAVQTLQTHLFETAALTKSLAAKIGLAHCGEIIGLLHDFGKFSSEFQRYIRQDTNDFDVDFGSGNHQRYQRGDVDHSTAGAMCIAKVLAKALKGGQTQLLSDVLFLCIASHHSGLIDVVNADDEFVLDKRKQKPHDKTHFDEIIKNPHANKILQSMTLQQLLAAHNEFKALIDGVLAEQIHDRQKDFYVGFVVRLLFSCLIDADRTNSIAFENPKQRHELEFHKPDWQWAIDKVEAKYKSFDKRQEFAKHQGFEQKQALGEPSMAEPDNCQTSRTQHINAQRQKVAQTCLQMAQSKQGIFSLTVPTGGGKTLASLRFAVNHAKLHDLDRIIFVIPFTSIIEQNAKEVREIFSGEGTYGEQSAYDWVLEQHCNIEPDVQTWQSKLVMDSWNKPIIFTTMVQFLESCFAGGTKGVRRLHQLTNSVIVFDEIQTLPITCYHLFCNAVNFLTTHAKTTAVLCTATQPILHRLPLVHEGVLHTPTEIVGDQSALNELFDVLKRVQIHDCSQKPQSLEEMTDFVVQKAQTFDDVLVIVNTKAWARQLYQSVAQVYQRGKVFHLSTSQCANHRKQLLAQIKNRLAQRLPTIVISTQLIEAGVDISFHSVVRFVAGLDSVLQAAGRCNRHGELFDGAKGEKGQVFLIQPDKENLSRLKTIEHGKACMLTILQKLAMPENKDKDLLEPRLMAAYFSNFVSSGAMKKLSVYPVDNYSMMTYLSGLPKHNDNKERYKLRQQPKLYQSFMAAGKAFQAIDAPTKAVIAPFGEEGKALITKLCEFVSKPKDANFYALFAQVQGLSVNVFAHEFAALEKSQALTDIDETGLMVLDERFYDDEYGLNLTGDGKMTCEIW